jgi:hypothetical protein
MLDPSEVEKIIATIDDYLQNKCHRSLKPAEKIVLAAVFNDITYKEAGKAAQYTESFLQNTGSKLFFDLSKVTKKVIKKRNSKSELISLFSGGGNGDDPEKMVRVEIYLAGNIPKSISILENSYEIFIKPATIRYFKLFGQTISRHIDRSTSPESLAKDLLDNIHPDIDRGCNCGSDLGLPICKLAAIPTLIVLYSTSLDPAVKDIKIEPYSNLMKLLVCHNHQGCLLTNFSLKQINSGKICKENEDRNHPYNWISLDIPANQILSTIDGYLEVLKGGVLPPARLAIKHS